VSGSISAFPDRFSTYPLSLRILLLVACCPGWYVALRCCRYLPHDTQVVVVSATLPHEVLEMTKKW